MSKKANGEGSIYQRKSDGRWAASISVAKGRRKHFLGKNRDDVARQFRAALKRQDDGLPIITERQTVAQFMQSWLKATKPTIRERTWVRYEQYVRLHVEPELGKISLGKLTLQHLQRLYADRLSTGLSPTSVHHLHAVLHRALEQAVRWDLVARNVADRVDPPRIARFEIRAFTPDEARLFLNAVAGDRLEALYVLAITTGMREGELLGLRWPDVDLDRAAVVVRGSLQRIGGALVVTEPKTAHSQRQVALTPSAVAALRRHRIHQAEERLRLGAAWENEALVFTNEAGRPIGASSFLRTSFLPLLKRAGLPRMRFHDLRHSAATLMLHQGIHPKIVAEMLGHSRISTTLDLYSHVTPTLQQQATAAMEAILNS